MKDRIKALENALEWYAEQARLCRLIHSEGDAGRQSLSDDGGSRARAALATSQPAQPVARMIETAQWARNRLEKIADDCWHGDARDFKRALIGVFADFDEALANCGSSIPPEIRTVTPALEVQPLTVQDAARVPEIAALIEAAKVLHTNAVATKARTIGGVCGQTIDCMLRSTFHQASIYDLDALSDALRAITEGRA